MEKFLSKAVDVTLVGLAWLLIVFAGAMLLGGTYAMTDGNLLATVAVLWITFCLVWAIMASLKGDPLERKARADRLNELTRAAGRR